MYDVCVYLFGLGMYDARPGVSSSSAAKDGDLNLMYACMYECMYLCEWECAYVLLPFLPQADAILHVEGAHIKIEARRRNPRHMS